MHGLTGSDGGKVTVTLIGEYELIGLNALDAGGNGAGTAVSGFNYVELIEIIKEH
jgi:hypothetical protein